MIRLRIFTILALLGLLLSSVGGVAAQGDVGAQHTSPTWHGVYFNNPTLTGPAAFEREDPNLDFNWGGGSPQPGTIGDNYFSVRWTRYLDVTPGTYRFTAISDDGIRVIVDGQTIIDQWSQHPAQTYTADIYLGAGHHLVTVEYFEWEGDARVAVNWAPASGPAPGGGFTAEYFPNTTLSGSPITTRIDPAINFDWGYSSPFPAAFGTDYFSVRWTQTINFEPGMYRFLATADDGVRLWVNGHLLIDQWREQSVRTFSGDIYLNGPAEVKMEYFELAGLAVAKLNWIKDPGATPTPPSTGVYYLVQRGDTLSAIARRFGTTVQAIMSANGLTSTLIYVGQTLLIPVGAPPPGAHEVIVDDGSIGFVQGGAPRSWRTAAAGYGNHMTWTLNNWTEQPNYNWARWYPQLSAGRYEVFVHIPNLNANTTRATYWISHADGYTSRVVNQAAYSNQWVSLGTYRFRGSAQDYVSLNDITGEPYLSRRIGFDAVRWVPR